MSLMDKIKQLAAEISRRRKFVHGDKGKLENVHRQLENLQPDNAFGKASRMIGLKGIDLAWFLFCIMKFGLKDTKTLLFDNSVIDKWTHDNQHTEIQNDDSKFKKVFKKLKKSHPQIAATLKLWMVYALMTMSVVGGGKVIKRSNDKQELKKELKQNQDEKIDAEIDEEKKHTFAAYKSILQPITPWIIAELILAEGVAMKNGLHVPYLDGNGNWTIGFGSTVLKDGSSVTANTPPITTEEAYDLVRWHLEDRETYFNLYCYAVADSNLFVRNTGEAFGLSSVLYNSGTKFIEDENDRNHKERFGLLRKEYKKYGAAIPDSIVKKLFEQYPMRNKCAFGRAWIDSHKSQDMANAIGEYTKDGGGMYWRRWLEAGLFTGDIDPTDLLECPVKGMYDFYMYMGGYKKYKGSKKEDEKVVKQKDKELKKSSLWEKTEDGWTPKKSTYRDFKEWLKNPKTREKGTGKESSIGNRPKVKDFLPPEILEECMKGKCEIGGILKPIKDAEKIEKQTYIIGYDDYYQSAMESYANGDYVSAIAILDTLSKAYPNNALLHNDLALIYNKIGEYEKAIEHVHIIIYKIGDKTQYGAAQYNAGVAYEHQGDFERALKNYKLALYNGNKVARDAIKRVKKKLSEQDKDKTVVFNKAVDKVKQAKKNIVSNKSRDDGYTA